MSIEMFLEKTNVYLLWDVLIDEPMIKQICNSQIKTNELQTIFETNIKAFFVREKNNYNSLVELNKKYILLLINYIIKLQDNSIDEVNRQNSQNVQNVQNSQGFKKIKIHEDDTIQQQITYEDIHNERISKFEKELTKKQEEFTTSMSVSVPPTPNFNDKLDEPINEIELEIKRIQEQRNYDIELINRSYNANNISNNKNWLTSQETSIKNEKLTLDFQSNMTANTKTNTNVSKHITWSNENQFYEPVPLQEHGNNQETIHDNIFNKLKKIEPVNYQTQIDELKNELSSLHNKINIILEKMNT
jgi:hypothetical protein